jgi:hypothetical protein
VRGLQQKLTRSRSCRHHPTLHRTYSTPQYPHFYHQISFSVYFLNSRSSSSIVYQSSQAFTEDIQIYPQFAIPYWLLFSALRLIARRHSSSNMEAQAPNLFQTHEVRRWLSMSWSSDPPIPMYLAALLPAFDARCGVIRMATSFKPMSWIT